MISHKPSILQSFIIVLALLPLQVFSEDTGFEESLFDGDEVTEDASTFEIFAEAQLRQDAVRDLPRPVNSDFDRTLLRARLGIIWSNDILDIGLIGKINQNSDDNDESRENLDNERADAESIDSAFLTYRYSMQGQITLGQTELPIALSEAVWDRDLRPRGLTLQQDFALGDFSMMSLRVGTYEVNHVFDDAAELDAIQASFFIAEGAPTSYSAQFAYLSFSDLDEIVANRIARTNSRSAGRLTEDFKLMNVQLGATFNQLDQPLRFGLDLIRNREARKGDAARFDVSYGDSQIQNGWELGLSFQRIQQNAVIAAFADDDWWFNTNVRGAGLNFAYGFTESLRLRAAIFNERRDDQTNNNRRALLELQWTL